MATGTSRHAEELAAVEALLQPKGRLANAVREAGLEEAGAVAAVRGLSYPLRRSKSIAELFRQEGLDVENEEVCDPVIGAFLSQIGPEDLGYETEASDPGSTGGGRKRSRSIRKQRGGARITAAVLDLLRNLCGGLVLTGTLVDNGVASLIKRYTPPSVSAQGPGGVNPNLGRDYLNFFARIGGDVTTVGTLQAVLTGNNWLLNWATVAVKSLSNTLPGFRELIFNSLAHLNSTALFSAEGLELSIRVATIFLICLAAKRASAIIRMPAERGSEAAVVSGRAFFARDPEEQKTIFMDFIRSLFSEIEDVPIRENLQAVPRAAAAAAGGAAVPPHIAQLQRWAASVRSGEAARVPVQSLLVLAQQDADTQLAAAPAAIQASYARARAVAGAVAREVPRLASAFTSGVKDAGATTYTVLKSGITYLYRGASALGTTLSAFSAAGILASGSMPPSGARAASGMGASAASGMGAAAVAPLPVEAAPVAAAAAAAAGGAVAGPAYVSQLQAWAAGLRAASAAQRARAIVPLARVGVEVRRDAHVVAEAQLGAEEEEEEEGAGGAGARRAERRRAAASGANAGIGAPRSRREPRARGGLEETFDREMRAAREAAAVAEGEAAEAGGAAEEGGFNLRAALGARQGAVEEEGGSARGGPVEAGGTLGGRRILYRRRKVSTRKGRKGRKGRKTSKGRKN